ncbi:MAG: aminotransferase class I/II-fold pyridoxal phosphate-dependent enzyme [Anaerolineaceae bacterium]|nr:aminotransferase class I/II-fold pyridoxal phosphate-dependent enzyme [Anaerolineaceae bacterium]
MPEISSRLQRLPPYFFAVIGQRMREMQAQNLDIIRLDIGNPDMPPPPHVLDAMQKAVFDPSKHGYSGYQGIPAFREAVARYYQHRFGVSLNPDTEVLPLIGSKEGIVNMSLGYLDAGDISLVPDVSYPSYATGARLAGAEVHWLPMRAENQYLVDVSDIPDQIAARAKVLWVNYPNNPTGATANVDFYRDLVAFSIQNDILLLSDNPYVEVTFDGYRASSALSAPDAMTCTVEFMSFSKTFNMGGWRLGAAVGNAQALQTLLQVKSNVDSGHFHAIYDAGIAALDHTPRTWIDERNLIYQRRRDRIMQTLPQIGLEAENPKGTLYIWARVKHGSAEEYIEQVLTQARVALAPGGAYGHGGEHYIRLSVSVPDDRLDEALTRLETWYTSNYKPSISTTQANHV